MLVAQKRSPPTFLDLCSAVRFTEVALSVLLSTFVSFIIVSSIGLPISSALIHFPYIFWSPRLPLDELIWAHSYSHVKQWAAAPCRWLFPNKCWPCLYRDQPLCFCLTNSFSLFPPFPLSFSVSGSYTIGIQFAIPRSSSLTGLPDHFEMACALESEQLRRLRNTSHQWRLYLKWKPLNNPPPLHSQQDHSLWGHS